MPSNTNTSSNTKSSDSLSESVPAKSPKTLRYTFMTPRLWFVIILLTVIAGIAQYIGTVNISIFGLITVAILPLVWGLLIAGIVSAQPWRKFPLDLQATASTIMGVAVLMLIARLGFNMGPNIRMLFEAGPALLLQEVGHLFGTILIALPLAVLLRMGPATVGATFSIDRESAFAMVSERYGTDSPQYKGVLSMYAFGTLFGTIIISTIASIMVSLDIFDPRALAMGSGVGSGSMMAAASGAVAEAHPELADQVLALAATSNIITSLLGVYVGMYIALPLADKYYNFLTRRQKVPAQAVTQTTDTPTVEAPKVNIPLWTALAILVLVGVLVNIVAAITPSKDSAFDAGSTLSSIGGFIVLAALVALALFLSKLTKGKVGAMFIVISLSALISTPWSPIAEPLLNLVNSVDFIALCTVVLTAAGLSLGKDLPMLKAIGWKIIPVGFVAITSAYLLASTVAQLVLTVWN